MNSDLRMIVSGGGTGGHFFPAQAIMDALTKKGVKVVFIGSRFGVETSYFKYNSKDSLLLNIRGIQRSFDIISIFKNLLFPWRFFQSYIMARKLINTFNPHVVIGTGGYSSGIPLLVAIHKGINTVIQEQNIYPGITSRYLSSRVNTICIAFKETENYLKKKIPLSLETLFARIFN